MRKMRQEAESSERGREERQRRERRETLPIWFVKLCQRIERLEIQGAERVARAAVEGAARLMKAGTWNTKARERLFATRPTEPMMRNAITYLEAYATHGVDKVCELLLRRFDEADARIAESAAGLMLSLTNDGARTVREAIYATHCHSSTVVAAFLLAKERGARFTIHNTETRPLFQGRITATELASHGIPVVHFVDSAARLSLKGASALFLGADALLSDGTIVNKIGSELLAELAKARGIPVYVLASSWKYAGTPRTKFKALLEERSPAEVWPDAPRGVTIENPAFEFVSPRLITAIITEEGICPPREQVRRLERHRRSLARSLDDTQG